MSGLPTETHDFGWTGHAEADNAIILLGRLDVSSDDDLRVDQIERAVRYLAKQAIAPASRPVSDDLLVQLFYAAQGDITKFRIKARAILERGENSLKKIL